MAKLYQRQALGKAQNILSEVSHPLYYEFVLFPSVCGGEVVAVRSRDELIQITSLVKTRFSDVTELCSGKASYRTDFLVTTGTDTGNDVKILRRCRCGWEKETTFRGLRIHQGKKKCQAGGQQQHCSATAGQTRGTQSQVANHSAEGSNVAEGRQVEDTGEPLVDTYSSEGGAQNILRKPSLLNPSNQEPGLRPERSEPGRRQLVKWPKANEVAVWQQLDEDLCLILEQSLRGQVETKLNRFGVILYEECRSRFG
ncbi:hypothetical protein F2P79_023149 [Pimephales promelas]|nr:hypothetical protein F2P79_023149 [Pimephales promelas]